MTNLYGKKRRDKANWPGKQAESPRSRARLQPAPISFPTPRGCHWSRFPRNTMPRTREITSTRTLTPAKDIENTRSPENTKVQPTLTSASTWTTLKNCRTLLYRCHHITKRVQHRPTIKVSTQCKALESPHPPAPYSVPDFQNYCV